MAEQYADVYGDHSVLSDTEIEATYSRVVRQYLSSEVHDCVNVVLFQHEADEICALDVSLHKLQSMTLKLKRSRGAQNLTLLLYREKYEDSKTGHNTEGLAVPLTAYLKVGKVLHGVQVVHGRAVVQFVQHHHLGVARDDSGCAFEKRLLEAGSHMQPTFFIVVDIR